MSRFSRPLTALFALGFAASLYVGAATASLSEKYQPGIQWVVWSHGVIVLSLLLLLAVAAAWPAQRRRLAPALQRAFAATFAGSLVVGIVIVFVTKLGLECTQSWPARRGLLETIRTSTFCPRFSLRSHGAPFQIALLSPAFYAIARSLAAGAQPSPGARDRVAAAVVGGLALAACPLAPLAIFALPGGWQVRSLPSFALATVVLGLALQFLLVPFVWLSERLRAPLWVGPIALWIAGLALLQGLDWANPTKPSTWIAVAIYAAFPAAALLGQLAVLRTPLPRRIWPGSGPSGSTASLPS